MGMQRFILMISAALLLGCQRTYDPMATLPKEPPMNMRRIPITPAIQQFVAERYKESVLKSLAAPTTATVHEPTSLMVVIRNTDERAGFIWAFGNVDAQNMYGAMLTEGYTVVWTVRNMPDGLNAGDDGNDGFCMMLGGHTTTPDVPTMTILEYDRMMKANDAPRGELPAATRPVNQTN